MHPVLFVHHRSAVLSSNLSARQRQKWPSPTCVIWHVRHALQHSLSTRNVSSDQQTSPTPSLLSTPFIAPLLDAYHCSFVSFLMMELIF